MGKITALRVGKNQRMSIFLDGKLALGLEVELATKEGLRVGQELSAEQIEAMANSARGRRCLKAAVGYLNSRPRSESELRERLGRRGFAGAVQETVIAQMKEQGLVDDMAFAQFWKDDRDAFSPRSRGLTRLELRRKGVADEVIEQVVNTIDDEESAYRAAWSKADSLSRSDYASFCRRLGGYLRRRGFSDEVIDHTIKEVWSERGRKGG